MILCIYKTVEKTLIFLKTATKKFKRLILNVFKPTGFFQYYAPRQLKREIHFKFVITDFKKLYKHLKVNSWLEFYSYLSSMSRRGKKLINTYVRMTQKYHKQNRYFWCKNEPLFIMKIINLYLSKSFGLTGCQSLFWCLFVCLLNVHEPRHIAWSAPVQHSCKRIENEILKMIW